MVREEVKQTSALSFPFQGPEIWKISVPGTRRFEAKLCRTSGMLGRGK